MSKTDLSTEVLLARREMAERAAPGPWKKGIALRRGYGVDAALDCNGALIADTEFSDSPREESNIAHIAANSPDVVIATIDELLRLRDEIEQYKDSIQSLQHVANKTLAECNFRIKENISLKEELLRQREENGRLEKEADWLAQSAANCGWMGRRVSPEDMREAARRAVEE